MINCEELICKISDGNECLTLKDLEIDGNDIKKLGFSGKKIGEVLNLLLENVLDGTLPNGKKELVAFAEALK